MSVFRNARKQNITQELAKKNKETLKYLEVTEKRILPIVFLIFAITYLSYALYLYLD